MKSFRTITLTIVILIMLVSFVPVQSDTVIPVILGDAALESVQVVLEFTQTHDPALLASDAMIYVSGRSEPVVEQPAAVQLLNSLYTGIGNDILGVTIEPLRLIPFGDKLVIFEYVYHGTAFVGDDYMRDNMLDPVEIHVPMVSIYEVENGAIICEMIFEASTPLPFRINDIQ